MKWTVVVFLCFAMSVCTDDVEDKLEETSEENVREVREYSPETWRGVEQYVEPNFDWVPHEPPPDYKPKRRRLRKRKRRPPTVAADDADTNDYLQERPLRRRVRPFRLQQSQQPWEEMQDEPDTRPNIRRRIIPVFNAEEETTEWEGPKFIFPSRDTINSRTDQTRPKDEDKKIEVEVENQTSANRISDLKNLLKQSGPLSLSEILQQKNLSLSELLSGNEKAISALTEKPSQVTQRMEFSSSSYLPLGPQQTTRNYISNIDDSLEQVSVKDFQKKRLANFNLATEEKFPLVTKLDVVTEPITERRIFVPSHPKYYTSLSFKPDFDTQSERLTEPVTTSTTTTTTTEMHSTTLSSFKQKLPTTNARLRFTLKEKEENYPLGFQFLKPVKINLNEVTGLEDYKSQETTETPSPLNSDEPLRMPIDIDAIIENTKVNMSKQQAPTEFPIMNITYVTAREEIMEVLSDPVSREKLSKILKHRNMTVEELVQQRERGSSQRHLADIFHNNSREPEPKDEPHIAPVEGHFEPELFKQYYERQQKSQKFEDVKKVPAVTEQTEISKLKESIINIDSPNITENRIEPIPWIGEIISVLPTEGDKIKNVNIPKSKFSTEDYFLEDIPRIETVDNTFALASNEELNVDEVQSDDETFFKIPSGVKSALFVSLAIIGLSMIIFLTILIIFKWSQKDKRNINYCRSLSSRFRSPIMLQGRSTNVIRTFVNETLGRRKNYYKNNVQRMCDDIWEGGKDMEKKLSF